MGGGAMISEYQSFVDEVLRQGRPWYPMAFVKVNDEVVTIADVRFRGAQGLAGILSAYAVCSAVTALDLVQDVRWRKIVQDGPLCPRCDGQGCRECMATGRLTMAQSAMLVSHLPGPVTTAVPYGLDDSGNPRWDDPLDVFEIGGLLLDALERAERIRANGEHSGRWDMMRAVLEADGYVVR